MIVAGSTTNWKNNGHSTNHLEQKKVFPNVLIVILPNDFYVLRKMSAYF